MREYGNGTPMYLKVQLFMFYSKKYTTLKKKKMASSFGSLLSLIFRLMLTIQIILQ